MFNSKQSRKDNKLQRNTGIISSVTYLHKAFCLHRQQSSFVSYTAINILKYTKVEKLSCDYLSFLHHTNIFKTDNSTFSCKKTLKAQHQLRSCLNKFAILFHNIMEIFDLPYLNLLFVKLFINSLKSRNITIAFIYSYLLRMAFMFTSFTKECFSSCGISIFFQ